MKADDVFKRIDKELTPKYKGKIVAIHEESGDYYIGDSELDAYDKAVNDHPNELFVFKRIGFKYTHFVGAI